MTKSNSVPGEEPREISRQVGRMTRRGFAWGGAAALAGFAGWKWVGSRGRGGWSAGRSVAFSSSTKKSRARPLTPLGCRRSSPPRPRKCPGSMAVDGLDETLDLAAWRLTVQGTSGTKTLSIDDVKALPRFEMTTELRCIEGWSEVVTWAGARLIDLASSTGLARRSGRPGDPLADPADLLPYVSLTTPNAKYFVGLDMASALHPQTLLCYEMNGQPLTVPHGAPLRLAIPVKYGIKNLKQIGTILFTESRPADYWATKGYDWYAGFWRIPLQLRPLTARRPPR